MSNDVSIAEIKVSKALIKFEVPTSLYNMVSEHANSSEELKLLLQM